MVARYKKLDADWCGLITSGVVLGVLGAVITAAHFIR